ncbi:hypothetical protein QVD17_09407 [Tagetes erecta]|uniref:Auxin efflux carrier component n=1 Tax=Tagetes erecta TaxID=13708 RepID=A0AAD8NYG0_TARER|nr:hypothetical protein QVD17_09407 [Tagetes erecta]
MIGWLDIYNVTCAMFPLYVALVLGYGSVKWWHMFKADHCDAINRLNCYIIMPLFTFDFTTQIDPFKMNYKFIAADAISKAIILITISLWAKCSVKGSYQWSVTSFSLSSLNNSLVVGVPLMRAMYGNLGENLVIQSSILQSLFWNMLLLFMLEFERAKQQMILDVVVPNDSSAIDIENNENGDTSIKPSILVIMKIVGVKIAKNPNSYACILGLFWALVAHRWSLKMPQILEGSIKIMSKAGSGVAMFCIGLFMALQEKIVHCSVKLTIYAMVLRFVAAPGSMAVGSLSMGLRGIVLQISIIQAALPQAITSFVYAKEYSLHVNVLSTAVIFGTIVSLPLLVAYYALLGILHG